jgi:hypothetical protein
LVSGGAATVGDPDDCTSLDVRVARAERGRLAASLVAARLGSWTGGPEAELDVAGLRAGAEGGPIGADWPARWAAMIGYAATMGWLSADGGHVRAHIVDID